MPQMSPLWWEILFMLFLSMYMLMNMITYWIKKPKINSMMNNIKNNKEMNWKF